MWRFTTYRDKTRQWRWRITAQNGRIVADSGESYQSRNNALRAARRFAAAVRDQSIVFMTANL